MRIVCVQCQTRYIVPDEKIVKSVVQMTCPKCGHVITARVYASPSTPSGTLEKWSIGGGAFKRAQCDETPVWYCAYNGESVGPFTEEELKEKLRLPTWSNVAALCYVWRQSFSEWKPIREVEPFASALHMPAPEPRPAPVPKKKIDETLPPLFSVPQNTASLSESMASSERRTLDLSGLKQRLRQTRESDEVIEKQRDLTPSESLDFFKSVDRVERQASCELEGGRELEEGEKNEASEDLGDALLDRSECDDGAKSET